MTLTLGGGPLATPSPDTVNYLIDGPPHRLLMTPFPRRVRGLLNGTTLFDTVRGQLVHESNILPVLYVPREDVLVPLEPSEKVTFCPFKGDATHFHAAGGADVAWSYEEPLEVAAWLQDLVAFYAARLDGFLDEDEPVTLLRDPYHRTDVRRSSRLVRVTAGGELVAQSERALVLSETGVENRWYIPREDIRADLRPSATTAHCPYKGDATAFGLDGYEDCAWSYDAPYDSVAPIAGHVMFVGEGIEVEA
jgi:uncharacterized protein (DUF427 family)